MFFQYSVATVESSVLWNDAGEFLSVDPNVVGAEAEPESNRGMNGGWYHSGVNNGLYAQ